MSLREFLQCSRSNESISSNPFVHLRHTKLLVSMIIFIFNPMSPLIMSGHIQKNYMQIKWTTILKGLTLPQGSPLRVLIIPKLYRLAQVYKDNIIDHMDMLPISTFSPYAYHLQEHLVPHLITTTLKNVSLCSFVETTNFKQILHHLQDNRRLK